MESELIKQDANFLEFPLYVVNSRSKQNKFEIETSRGKYIYEASVNNIPDSVDALILYYLLHVVQKTEEDSLTISRYRIAKKTGLPLGKNGYLRIQKSLQRWLKVSANFEGNFYDNREYLTKGFHILSYSIDKKSKRIKITFDKDFLAVIRKSKFFKYVNLSYFKSLKKPLSRRLYEYLLKQFIKENSFSIGIKNLAEKMTLTSNYPSEIERKLKPALKEINNYLKDYRVELIIYKNQSGESIAEFSKTERKESQNQAERSLVSLPEPILKNIPEKLKTTKVIKLIFYYLGKGVSEEFLVSNIIYSTKRFKKNFFVYLKKALFQDYAHEEREIAIKEREIAEQRKKLLEEEVRIAQEREKLKEEKEAKEQEHIYFLVSQLPEHDRNKIEKLAAEDMRRFHMKPTITEDDKLLYTSIAFKKLGYNKSSNS